MKERVLILCTHNSARSQMAEGFLRHMAANRFEVASAGTEKTQVRPEAVAAMQAHGIDIGHQRSKALDQFLDEPWDYLITVCDQAHESCPVFPGAKHRLHWSFPDPSAVQGPDRQSAFNDVAKALHDQILCWLVHLEDQ